MGWFFGFKLHLLCDERGELIGFVLTRGNVDDRGTRAFGIFKEDLFERLYADKGYISKTLFEVLWQNGTHIVTGLKSNMKNKLMPIWEKIMLRERSFIDTINDVLKNVAQLVHTRHHSIAGFLINALSALSSYCFFEKKSLPSMQTLRLAKSKNSFTSLTDSCHLIRIRG